MSNLFFRNPRLSALAVCLILVAGNAAYFTLPRLEDPILSDRFATVKTRLPGATPDRVEALVTEKVENELDEIDEIKSLESISTSEVSIITIELRDEIYAVDEVWSRIRDKLDDVRPELPAAAADPAFEIQDARARALIVGLSWTGDGTPDESILSRRAEDLADRLRALSGTEEVEVYGAPDEEILVEVDPERLIGLGMTATDLAAQLAGSDAKVAAGQLRSGRDDVVVELTDEFDTVERVRRTPIRNAGDASFAVLGDVASVRRSTREPADDAVLVSGRTGLALAAFVLPERRVDLWAKRATRLLEDYEAELPAGLDMQVLFDQSRYTEERLSSLLGNLGIGAAAVVLVVLLMMGWRSALLVGVSLPLSALMVFAGMQLFEVPIHQMSVTGLIIALGLLIDNAIVMVDEVRRELRHGESPADAISGSVRKLFVPLLGSTLTTALAFMPIALMPGPAGEFAGTIAISVILALVSSFFLAMTIVPAFTGLVDGGRHDTDRRSLWTHGFDNRGMTEAYRGLLRTVFARPWAGIAIGLCLPIIGFVCATTLQEQFFPPTDRDQFHVEFELPPQTSLAETERTVLAVRELLLDDEAIVDVHWFLGRSAPSFYYNLVESREFASHFGHALVTLRSAEGGRDVIRRTQRRLDEAFPRARALARQLEQGPPFPAPIELRLFGPDLDELRRLGREARLALSSVDDVVHTRAELNEARPKIGLRVDEESLRLAGLGKQDVARQLDALLEGAIGGSVIEEIEELPVRVRVGDASRGQLERLLSLELIPRTTGDGSPIDAVPIGSVAELDYEPEASSILRRNGRRVNTVQGYVTAGVLPADVLDDYRARLRPLLSSLPTGYDYDFGGETSKRDEAVGNLMGSVAVLLVLQVATLVLSFSSFRMAGVIGGVGALSVGLGMLGLFVFGYPFGFMAIVGTMGLVGVAINDTIVVLAAIREDERARAGDPFAVANVVVGETRHVLATTLTTIAGFIPLLVGGGGFWPPLAVTIAGGVGGATVLALVAAPAAYIYAMCPRLQSVVECDCSAVTETATVSSPVARPPLVTTP